MINYTIASDVFFYLIFFYKINMYYDLGKYLIVHDFIATNVDNVKLDSICKYGMNISNVLKNIGLLHMVLNDKWMG